MVDKVCEVEEEGKGEEPVTGESDCKVGCGSRTW